jgi:hypothetical protein
VHWQSTKDIQSSQQGCSTILFSFHSFPEFHSIFTITNMLCIWICIWSCLFFCIYLSFGSIFHVWEKTCVLCLSELSLLHLTWCPPSASIYFPTTWHYSLRLSKVPLFLYTTFFLIHSSVTGHLVCFHRLPIVNSAIMHISVQVSLLYPDLCSFGNMPSCDITRSYDSSIF